MASSGHEACNRHLHQGAERRFVIVGSVQNDKRHPHHEKLLKAGSRRGCCILCRFDQNSRRAPDFPPYPSVAGLSHLKNPDLPPLKIVVAHGVEDARTVLHTALLQLRHEDVLACTSGRELIQLSKDHSPDLIITGVDLPDVDGVAALIEISQTQKIPAIVVTQQSSLELVERALEDHVMAYLLEPVNVEEILPTIYLVLRRFEQFQELEQENESLKQALADRKVIERAKGVLMRHATIDEETAYKRLRRLATDNRMKMVEAAERVISVLALLEP